MTLCIGRNECGCEIRQDHDGRADIFYCAKHYYTSDLYEAVLNLHAEIGKVGFPLDIKPRTLVDAMGRGMRAIAKAEGK